MNRMPCLEYKGLLAILATMITLTSYMVFLIESSRQFIDVWPLEGVFWETTITILALSMLSYILFRNWASVIFSLSVQVFLVILLPVLKYPNALNIIGPWDSAAHYSFAKWIIEKGHVDTAGNLYYSSSYGFHSGNGILPATLSIVSSLNLGWSMNAVLVVGYLGYVLFLMATLKGLGHLKQERVGLGDVLWLLAIFTMSIYLPDSFCGQGLGFVYVGFISYLFLRQFIKEDERLNRTTVLLLMALLGLLVTHLSTVVIVVAYLFITTAILLIMEPRRREVGIKAVLKKLIAPIAPLLLAFIVYEVCVDVSLFNAFVKAAIHMLSSLYAEEVVIAGKAMEVRGLSITDLFLYLISTHTKVVLILAIALLHTIALVCKRKALNDDERRLVLLLVTSYPTWAIGWAGVGSLISSIRAIAVISFLLSLSIATTYKKLCNFVTKKFLLMIPIVLIVLGFSSNFGLPFEPTIKSDGEAYTYPTFSPVRLRRLRSLPNRIRVLACT